MNKTHRIGVAAVCTMLTTACALAADAPSAPPTRPFDAPGAPHFTVIEGRGANAPADVNGNFVIGPDYVAAPELAVNPAVPQGTVQQFVMEPKDSRFYPGIARDVFGTVDPANPKTLIDRKSVV